MGGFINGYSSFTYFFLVFIVMYELNFCEYNLIAIS